MIPARIRPTSYSRSPRPPSWATSRRAKPSHDFGTGFGSFTYLKALPIGYLKIDVEFVRGLVSSAPNQHLVKAIVSLARGFGHRTIAEGVEDQETLELLREYGVDFAQGYFLGRPAPIPPV